jgi:hypothetical protein
VTDPDAVLSLCTRRDELPLAADAYLDAGRAEEAAVLLALWAGDREPKYLTDPGLRETLRGLWRWFVGLPSPPYHPPTQWARHWLPPEVVSRMPGTHGDDLARNYPTYGAAWLAYLKAEAAPGDSGAVRHHDAVSGLPDAMPGTRQGGRFFFSRERDRV